MDMDEMVRMMMQGQGGGGMGGMGGMGGGQQRRRKGKDVGIAFPVTLEDLYTGKTATVPREKVILCPQCKGSGSSKPGQSAKCMQCRGQGARVMMRQIGPGMMQQMQVPCEACNGRGSALKDADKCKSCFGSATKQVDQPLTVNIEPGMENEQQIPFMGEGDQSPDYDIPGAIVIVLRQLKHDTFVRDDDNLHIEKSISLAEAMCGTTLIFKHLDDREVAIKITPEDGIKPGVEKVVKGMGMPSSNGGRMGGAKKFGDLIIKFNVTFPEKMSEEAIAALRKVLPPPATQAAAIPEEHEESYMSRTALDEMRKEMQKEAEDDDDEDGQGGGVRCAQQ